MAIPPTGIRILFTNYDIIAYFLSLASCSEHFISIKHRILATFNINKKIQFWQPLRDGISQAFLPFWFVDVIVITDHDLFWNVVQANCILKYFENMMVDHSDSTIF